MTPIPGVGLDVLSVERLESALERRPRLAERLFTRRELDECGSRARPGRHLAGRFCAKEAAIKALGMRHAAIADFEVVGGGDRPPVMVLSGAASELAGQLGVELRISISHDREIATAVAVAVGR